MTENYSEEYVEAGGEEPRTFGAMLKELRELWGLSQTYLSDVLGCDHSYISRLESEQRASPSYEFVTKTAFLFELDPTQRDELLYAAGFPKEDVVTVSKSDDPELAEMVRLIQSGGLNPEGSDEARRHVRSILALGRSAMR